MSLLTRVLSRSKPQPIPSVPCPHTALAPRWENIADLGKADRVSAYVCTACQKTFTAEEARPYLG